MAKKTRKLAKPGVTIRVGNPGNIVTIRIPGRSKKHALAQARRFVKHHTKNIEMGFYAGGMFHPIRGSKDYSQARAGEGRAPPTSPEPRG